MNKKDAKEKSDSVSLLYVGALNRRKNPQGILQAVELLKDQMNVRLKIVGSGGKSFDNNDFGVSKDIVNNVEFLGQINDTETLISLYKSADCFVFPSFYEASPLPVIEAMACGCPVVSSEIPSLKERCGEAAVYCNADDPKSIAKAIELIVIDKTIADEKRRLGFAQAKKYSWENCVRQTLDIIRLQLPD